MSKCAAHAGLVFDQLANNTACGKTAFVSLDNHMTGHVI